MGAARKTVRVAKVVEGGPIIRALRAENRELWTLMNLGFSAVLDAVEEIHRREVEQAAKLDRVAEVIAPTEEQMRARLLLDREARSFEPDMDGDLAPVRRLAR